MKQEIVVCQQANKPSIAIIDIGSNSIRLIVFSGLSRVPGVLLNKKAFCELGKNLQKTGVLNQEKIDEALKTLEYFVWLARNVSAEKIILLATAAIRDARNGRDFVQQVEQKLNVKIKILSGNEEATYSSMGVVNSILATDGIVGDLGGGSLELVSTEVLSDKTITMPVGPLRLQNVFEENGLSGVRNFIESQFKNVNWISPLLYGKNFYAVGGSWRLIARLHMHLTNYPVKIIHQYKIAADEIASFCEKIVGGIDKIAEKYNIPDHRMVGLPMAALTMLAVIKWLKPKFVEFSASGLREGCYYSLLPKETTFEDPLLSYAKKFDENGRFKQQGETFYQWLLPLIQERLTKNSKRLLEASCYLADFGWDDHADYPETSRFERILHLPVVGISHEERIALALIDYYRQKDDFKADQYKHYHKLLPDSLRTECYVIGLSLNIADFISGGINRILTDTYIQRSKYALTINLPKEFPVEFKKKINKTLKSLVKELEINVHLV